MLINNWDSNLISSTIGKSVEEAKRYYGLLMKEYADSTSEATAASLQYYTEMADEVSELGIDATRTIFGNIDTNNRQVLDWTLKRVMEYRKELESWGQNPISLLGSRSTV